MQKWGIRLNLNLYLTVLQALSQEIFSFKDLNYWLVEFPLPYLETHLRLMELTATCGRGENIVGICERLKAKMKLFFSKYLFCILISLSQKLI